MQKIAVLGLRKENQTVVSILHDLNVVQLEPLSKDVIPLIRNERDNDQFRQVSDQLLRMKALKNYTSSKRGYTVSKIYLHRPNYAGYKIY